ncbi:MAG: 50S ribosomal protein L7/L12 [Candidatus Moranbacteria bacterium GW2011_GWA2_39_41]|nr:MAG: 50S ribosomal protein L7/L12 [Candidatus Moranbacteria bacterium GW2011_GWA2_39_41]
MLNTATLVLPRAEFNWVNKNKMTEERDSHSLPADRQENISDKVQALREMIYNSEKSLQSAKAMLLQLEGKKKVGRKKKMEDDEEGRVIEGTFDGQIMLGTDDKQYPVPANYASKSKLIEGDMLKLTITPDGSFIYKQIGPIERTRLIGIVNQDEDGNYFIIANGKPYRVLLASVTYFKVEPGDEVTLVTPRDIDSDWASIENVIQKGSAMRSFASMKAKERDTDIDDIINDKKPSTPIEVATEPEHQSTSKEDFSIIDEWAPDIEELRRELNKPLNE